MMNRISKRAVLTVALGVLVATPARANDTYKVSGAEVVIVCPLTVGGSFEARTKNVKGEVKPAAGKPAVSGAVHVDLQSLETGIGLRDRHMRDNYLEVQKGPEFATATLEGIQIEKLEGKTTFKGTLLLHGQRKEVTGTAELRDQGGKIRVLAEFPVKVSEFSIPKPSYLGVGVTDEVRVKVTMTVESSTALMTSRQ
jgi:polyisoprenoid-binding protein YceI